jgi:hypothetical protein
MPAPRPSKSRAPDCVPANKVEPSSRIPSPTSTPRRPRRSKSRKPLVGQVPDARHGWLVALGLYLFMAFYAMGPGVCVWLALSELMPTRIRSNGMSIALVINQLVSTTLAGIFLPFVSKYGYSSMFFLFAGFTVVYFITASSSCPKPRARRWKRSKRMPRPSRQSLPEVVNHAVVKQVSLSSNRMKGSDTDSSLNSRAPSRRVLYPQLARGSC